MSGDRMLTEKELAGRWALKPETLKTQRHRRQGCPYIKLGGAIRYRLSDVKKIEEEGLVSTR